MATDTDLRIPPRVERAILAEWAYLAAPGTWFTGEERVAVAAEARRAWSGESPGSVLPGELIDVVRTIAIDSPLITADWVAALAEKGLDLPAYAELIGIVARLSSIDFFHRSLGLVPPALPEPQPGEPSRTPPPDSLVAGKSYVPMVERISIPQTISIVPAESAAWQALSDAMYMTFAEMDDPDFSRSLHRTQIELVAARTSQLNECFY